MFHIHHTKGKNYYYLYEGLRVANELKEKSEKRLRESMVVWAQPIK